MWPNTGDGLLPWCLCTRVSSKWKIKFFGSNRNKPKQDLFRVCFGLFRETKKKNFRFVSVFRTLIETTETNRTVSKRTETVRNFFSAKTYSRVKQKEAIRVINNAGYRDHTQPLLKKNKILPSDSRIKYSNLRFMHSYFHHNLPFSFEQLWIPNRDHKI